MRRTPTIMALIVVGALTIAVLTITGTARAQALEPTAVYEVFIPLVIDPTGASSPADQSFVTDVLTLVNVERAKVSCPTVTLDARLNAAAQAHTEDMARKGYFNHDSLDGTPFDERITRAGYDWHIAGENIAAGQTTPAAVMDAWMKSDHHRENILNCDYTNLGVGYYYQSGSPYSHYWTQDFATPFK